MTPDQVNGLFELVGAIYAVKNVARVLRDKQVAGIAWDAVAFWSVWGVWNLYYYPSLHQWASFSGGLLLVLANTTYVSLLLYYGQRDGKGSSV